LTLPDPVRASWLLRIWRLTSSSLAGTTRTEVAVGTPRLASMFSTVRAAAPRSGSGSSPSSTIGPGRADAGVGATGAGVAAGAASATGATGAGGAGAAPSPVGRVASEKYARQWSSTEAG